MFYTDLTRDTYLPQPERGPAAREAIPRIEAMMEEIMGKGELSFAWEGADGLSNARLDALHALDTMLAYAYAVVGRDTIKAEAEA